MRSYAAKTDIRTHSNNKQDTMDNNFRKLTRSTTDRKIAGVCGGIAEYLNVDPTVVRIIFLFAFLCGSFGLWAYLIVWIAAPEDNRLNPREQ